MRAAVLVRGDFWISTDLSQARFEQVDPARRTATLVLPQPVAANPRLDHEHTRLFALTPSGLWQLKPEDETHAAIVSLAFRDAQRLVAESSEEDLHRATARLDAERVLKTFLGVVGWEVAVRWTE